VIFVIKNTLKNTNFKEGGPVFRKICKFSDAFLTFVTFCLFGTDVGMLPIEK